MYLADVDDGRRVVSAFIDYYNTQRLHSAIGYVSPADKLCGREPAIFKQREDKLAEARQRRQTLRQAEPHAA